MSNKKKKLLKKSINPLLTIIKLMRIGRFLIKRYIIVLLYAIPCMSNAAMWATFSPISAEVKDYYGVSDIEVQYCSFVFMVVYIFVNFPSNYIIEEKSLAGGIFIGTGFTIAGTLLRILIKRSFIYVLLGQTLGAIGY